MENKYYAGFDIGGTKCAAILALANDNNVEFLFRYEIKTSLSPTSTMDALILALSDECKRRGVFPTSSGVSCGGPLDANKGLIINPPNLIGWENFAITDYIFDKFGTEAYLYNDADASALAEWKYGAGRGTKNMIFLTFGTGLGAGLILNGALYSGTNGLAGEVGHIRLAPTGPLGYGKAGSFEGFCSGGGIGRAASAQFNRPVTAKDLFIDAEKGESYAVDFFSNVGERFGYGLAILVDLFNPERIVAGGVYMRAEKYIKPSAIEALKKEALPASLNTFELLPSSLGEKIGDYAAIVAAVQKR